MTEHTPGPWKITGPTQVDAVSVWSLEDGAVALLPSHDGLVPLERRLANARLIAAAPELLAALKDMITGLSMSNIRLLGSEDAKAAIAKAEDATP